MKKLRFLFLLFVSTCSLSAQTLITGSIKWCATNYLFSGNITVSLVSGDSVIQTTLTDSTGEFMFFTVRNNLKPVFRFSYYGQKLITDQANYDTAAFPNYTQMNYRVFCSSLSMMTIDSLRLLSKDSIHREEHIMRYGTGAVYMRGGIENWQRSGQWLVFYSDGKLWSVGTYKNGEREGYGISWYANGKKRKGLQFFETLTYIEWAHLGSNQGPPDYESGALTS